MEPEDPDEKTVIEPEWSPPDMTGIKKLSRDLRNAAKLMGVREARYFVDTYYQLQGFRVASGNQTKRLLKDQEPSEYMTWLHAQLEILEGQIRGVLDKWSAAQPMGVWARKIVGIGPVISSGLVANIDITKAPTAGHIWSFAGLNPDRKWNKREKRPWNASLKRLAWITGDCFVKVSGHKNDIYGKLYLQRKEYERQKNENCDYRPECERRLEEDRKGKNRKKLEAGLVKLLETGKLPDMALHERSKRWAVKVFLGHWHDEAYRLHYGTEPPLPYPIAILGHVHRIGVKSTTVDETIRTIEDRLEREAESLVEEPKPS